MHSSGEGKAPPPPTHHSPASCYAYIPSMLQQVIFPSAGAAGDVVSASEIRVMAEISAMLMDEDLSILNSSRIVRSGCGHARDGEITPSGGFELAVGTSHARNQAARRKGRQSGRSRAMRAREVSSQGTRKQHFTAMEPKSKFVAG